MKPITASKYGTDGYKLSMGYIFWIMNIIQKQRIQARYEFVDRDSRVFPEGFANQLQEEIKSMASLSPDPAVSRYVMDKWPFINQEFLRWYDQVFYHDPNQVELSQKGGKLRLVVEGPIHTATHLEIPILRAISTLVTRNSGNCPQAGWLAEAERNAITLFENQVFYSEFGGRRPFSPEVHWGALCKYAQYRKTEGKGGLLGSSWVDYAYQLNLMIIGTMAHEYPQMMAALHGYENANKMAMATWVEHYGRRLGYYLTDTFTTEVTLRDFNRQFAETFEGVRQDSGNTHWFADRMVDHYRSLEIDASLKSVIYSNSLKTIAEILELNDYRPSEFRRSFGLGGFITNNVGHKPHNMVLKLVAVKVGDGSWIDTVKLSDDPRKSIGKPEEIAYCRRILKID